MAHIHGIVGSPNILIKQYPRELRLKNPDDLFYVSTKLEYSQRKEKANFFGVIGEEQVLSELKKLSDEYHVYYNVKVSLTSFVGYNDHRNLRTAQCDFIVIGPTGIFVIEVKNWGQYYISQHKGISPHEQLDRAGKVLWIFFHRKFTGFEPHITKVLVPIQNNLQYDPSYKSVLVRGVHNIRRFICESDQTLSDSEVNKIVLLLNN